MRIILFTGKGGVGKTTIAAATGVFLSEKKLKTLVISIDPAHSLSDVLEKEIGPEPTKIKNNLYAQEIDVYYSVQKHWKALKDYLKALFEWRGLDEIIAEEMSILPGMEEIAGFLWVDFHFRNKEYDVIILDSAPTGETLRFLSLPEIAEWWFRKIFPIQRKIVKTVRPALKKITDFPLPEEETYDDAQRLFDSLYSLHKIMQDPQISSIRIVTNPEKMVLKETQRAFTYLHLFGYPVDAVLINRIIKDKNFNELIKVQKEYIQKLEEFFYPIPVFKIDFYKEEVIGYEKLLKFAQNIYNDKDPSEIFYKDIPFEFKKKEKGYEIIFKLKNVPKGKVEIIQNLEEIVITIGNFRKYLYLPRNLMNYKAKGAKIDEEKLVIFLEPS
ncbi:MAG: TRC40/GET3/ArsA family transport-energizing ATPase [candidate division WOR-3 bacterium]